MFQLIKLKYSHILIHPVLEILATPPKNIHDIYEKYVISESQNAQE